MNEQTQTVTVTTKQLSEKLGLSYAGATGVLSLMVKMGAAKQVGHNKVEGQKGKAATLFEVNKTVTLNL